MKTYEHALKCWIGAWCLTIFCQKLIESAEAGEAFFLNGWQIPNMNSDGMINLVKKSTKYRNVLDLKQLAQPSVEVLCLVSEEIELDCWIHD